MPDLRTVVLPPPVIRTTLAAGQGPSGPVGAQGVSAGAVTRTVTSAIGGHRLVVSIAGAVAYADAANPAHFWNMLGLTLNAASSGGTVEIRVEGEVVEPSWSWVVDQPVFLASNGLLTQTVPTVPAFVFSQVVGFAVATDTIFLNVLPPITLSE